MASGNLEPDDTFVICSDDLTAYVDDADILALASQNLPQRACKVLVELTLNRGAADHVTLVAVRFGPDAPAPRGCDDDHTLEPR